jgi:hypothetical protein
MTIKIEHGKYYVARNGWIVGPARQVENPYPKSWALYLSEGKIFEVEGVEPEQAFQVELVEELGDKVGHYLTLEDRVAALEKMVVMNTHEECGEHDVFRVHSDLVLDEDVVAVVESVKRKMKMETQDNDYQDSTR